MQFFFLFKEYDEKIFEEHIKFELITQVLTMNNFIRRFQVHLRMKLEIINVLLKIFTLISK